MSAPDFAEWLPGLWGFIWVVLLITGSLLWRAVGAFVEKVAEGLAEDATTWIRRVLRR
ncbi:MAG: hypothetical protein M3R02_06945 [Chloroflexota bacterium]|nr:hypothetical protein [Chloroflexota bacterium]